MLTVTITADVADDKLVSLIELLGGGTVGSAGDAGPPDEEAVLAAVFEKLKARSPQPEKFQELYDVLMTLGFRPLPPDGAATYIRWMDPKAGATAALYINSATAYFLRKADRERLSALPGAITTTDRYVSFPIWEGEGFGTVIVAARQVKRM